MRKSRISKERQKRLIEHFVAGTTARCPAQLIGVNKTTAAYYFQRLREIICLNLEKEAQEILEGAIGVDESYFGRQYKGKRGREAGNKIPVFGLLKRGGWIYPKIIQDASSSSLMPIIDWIEALTSPTP